MCTKGESILLLVGHEKIKNIKMGGCCMIVQETRPTRLQTNFNF